MCVWCFLSGLGLLVSCRSSSTSSAAEKCVENWGQSRGSREQVRSSLRQSAVSWCQTHSLCVILQQNTTFHWLMNEPSNSETLSSEPCQVTYPHFWAPHESGQTCSIRELTLRRAHLNPGALNVSCHTVITQVLLFPQEKGHWDVSVHCLCCCSCL